MKKSGNEEMIMKRRCTTLGKFLRIVFWLSLTAAILIMLYLGVHALAAPESAFIVDQFGSDARVGFRIGNREFYLMVTDTSFHMGEYSCKALFGIVWVTALGYQILFGAFFWCLVSVFWRMQSDEGPFTLQCSRLIRRMGLLFLGMFVYRNVVESAVFFIFGPSTARIWISGLELALTGGVVLCLSCIFEYGAVLQRQSDETL